ncbi:MAG TPA: RimK family alpha-L-glutamate ligase [Longilinea sp.]|nr:RimK family alpha-L-glutamate ligase [Longilinea sp.]
MSLHQITIIGSPDSWHGQALARAYQKCGIQPHFVLAEHLQATLGTKASVGGDGVVLDQMDLVMVREVPGGSLEQVIYRMDALHQLENAGVRLVNPPGAIEKMVDKYYASSLLQGAGLLTPETVVTESYSETLQAFHALGGDVVVKPLFGSRGVGMVRVQDAEIAGRVFKSLQLGGYVYYLQRFIPHFNQDIRLFMIGDECISAMTRVSENWKSNISQGAAAQAYTPSEEEIKISIQAMKAVGAVYGGIDLLRGEDGQLYVLEVNSMPAWQGLQQVTPFDIADTLVEHFS